MYALFSICFLISATLIFWVQPLFGKMVLPLLGGSPAVWNTCLVFFQAALLLGYLYAHAQNHFFRLRRQLISHLIILVVVFFFLPLTLPEGWSPPVASSPIWWLLMLLTVAVGLPFAALSATAPLLQSWFAYSDDPRAADPYFLYAASNAGSLAGLLGYPLFFERQFTLAQQTWAWTAGYVLLFILIGIGAVLLWRSASPRMAVSDSGPTTAPEPWLRIRWILLAAVPSSLLQSVTLYLTTDIAAVPLLWVVPLALYLTTFVLVFSQRKLIPHHIILKILPVILIIAVVLIFWWEQRSWGLLFLLSLVVLFVTAMACHGEMVRLRPSTKHLTEFYLLMAFGGVLGGIFNAIVAPLIFDRLWEFPIGLVLAGLLMPRPSSEDGISKGLKLDILVPVAVGLALVAVVKIVENYTPISLNSSHLALIAAVGGVVVYVSRTSPLRFGLGLAAILVAGHVAGVTVPNPSAETIHIERSFFGILRVERDPTEKKLILRHGEIRHGDQYLDPKRRREPTQYYHSKGPVGDVFKMFRESPGPKKVAVAGLGAGTLAAYAQPGDLWVFYEIDPLVLRLARDDGYFTYMKDCSAKLEVVLGDARLSIAKAQDNYYDLIAIDVFSSDAIPVHLITKEAVQLYFSKLAPHGVVLFHISNKYIRLNRVLFKLGEELGLRGMRQIAYSDDGESLWPDAPASDWAVMARNEEDFGSLLKSHRWKPIASAKPVSRAWTDDYSNVLEFFFIPRWSRE